MEKMWPGNVEALVCVDVLVLPSAMDNREELAAHGENNTGEMRKVIKKRKGCLE